MQRGLFLADGGWGCWRTGSMTFVTPEAEVTASAGDLMTVPPGAVHTFKNASDTEDCECYMTATPGMKL